MKNIIYHKPEDAEKFDFNRYSKSLNKYAKIPDEAIEKALKTVEQYENMHVSVLVELGVSLIMQFGNETKAEKYYDEHSEYFFGNNFERLRRITGYLVGSLERWNDGKKAEEAARVKHGVCLSNKNGVYNKAQKTAREKAKSTAKKAVGKE